MRILLLASNEEVEPYAVFPLGMSVVANALSRDGHEVRLCDALSARAAHGGNGALSGAQSLLREAARLAATFRPQAIGISVRNIDNVDSLTPGSHWALDALRELARGLRALGEAPIILGGPGFSLMPEAILAYCGLDYGVAGEGERMLPHLLGLLEKGAAKPGVYRAAVDLPKAAPGASAASRGKSFAGAGGALAGPDIGSALYDPDMTRFYCSHSGVISLQSKRGCPHGCIYCTYSHLEGRKVRARDPESVVEDILRLEKDFAFQELAFADAVFNDSGEHWVPLVEEMIRRKTRAAWTAFFQPPGLDREAVRLCRAAGLKAVELGTDAWSDKTLSELGKGFAFDVALKATEACRAEKVPAAHFVIVGGPGETQSTLREGLENMSRLRGCVVFPYLGVRILPGAKLFEHAADEGLISRDDPCLAPTYYFSPHIDPAKTERMMREAFKGNRERVFPPSVGQERSHALRSLGYQGILWDTLVRF